MNFNLDEEAFNLIKEKRKINSHTQDVEFNGSDAEDEKVREKFSFSIELMKNKFKIDRVWGEFLEVVNR